MVNDDLGKAVGMLIGLSDVDSAVWTALGRKGLN
jgi:hypothetical protein